VTGGGVQAVERERHVGPHRLSLSAGKRAVVRAGIADARRHLREGRELRLGAGLDRRLVMVAAGVARRLGKED
jgi:hypothetical protein